MAVVCSGSFCEILSKCSYSKCEVLEMSQCCSGVLNAGVMHEFDHGRPLQTQAVEGDRLEGGLCTVSWRFSFFNLNYFSRMDSQERPSTGQISSKQLPSCCSSSVCFSCAFNVFSMCLGPLCFFTFSVVVLILDTCPISGETRSCLIQTGASFLLKVDPPPPSTPCGGRGAVGKGGVTGCSPRFYWRGAMPPFPALSAMEKPQSRRT